MKHTYEITGMTCSGCSVKVKNQIEEHKDVISAEILLEQNEAIIQMSKHIHISELKDLFGKDSKYSIDEKNDHHKEMSHSLDEPINNDKKNWLVTFRPLLTIFFFITLVSIITSFQDGHIDLNNWMSSFMAGFFLVFSFFKLLNIKSFADSYSTYDLLAKRVKGYGYVYPFLELGLGIAYLTSFEPRFTAIATIIIMGFSSIGVIQTVLDKKKIKCACLGDVFNLPMTTVTIIEDLLMVGMAIYMVIIG